MLLNASGLWDVSITPAYAFPVLSPTNPGEVLSWERRAYGDAVTFVAVPEPGAWGLLMAGVAAIGVAIAAGRARRMAGQAL